MLGRACRKFKRYFNPTIYHCCVQKSASRWFAGFLQDPRILSALGMDCFFDPKTNYTEKNYHQPTPLGLLPFGQVVSPIYINYEDLLRVVKPRRHKTFFVGRDPRDIVVSAFFSIRESHPMHHPELEILRSELQTLGQNEGIVHLLHSRNCKLFFDCLRSWIPAEGSDDFKLIHYEDFFGSKSNSEVADLMAFLGAKIPQEELNRILEDHSFAKKSGRQKGEEDKNHHYRKGVSGDWKNYFNDEISQVFNDVAGNQVNDFWAKD